MLILSGRPNAKLQKFWPAANGLDGGDVMYSGTRPVPSQELIDMAWKQIMVIAEAHSLIVHAYGGVATLAMPDEQREVPGLREKVLRAGLFKLEPGMTDKPPESV